MLAKNVKTLSVCVCVCLANAFYFCKPQKPPATSLETGEKSHNKIRVKTHARNQKSNLQREKDVASLPAALLFHLPSLSLPPSSLISPSLGQLNDLPGNEA